MQRFEFSMPCSIHTFQAYSFNHSDTSLCLEMECKRNTYKFMYCVSSQTGYFVGSIYDAFIQEGFTAFFSAN